MKKFARTTRKPPKIPSAENLKNVALFYLSRFAASESSLRRVLDRRILRAALAHPEFAADQQKQKALRDAIDAIVEAHKKSGAVNDGAFAAMKVAGLRRGGKSEKFIKQKLAVKGLQRDLVADALTSYDGDHGGEEAETKAALALCRKKRLGPFRPKDRQKEGDAQKDFARLARAGFSIAIIRKILKTDPSEGPDFTDFD